MVSDDVGFEIVVQLMHVVGYEFANETILLRLSLDGHQLETERILAKTDKVHVNTQVSWSTKKGDIKRMKAENLPLKIECFRIRERGYLQSIGYVFIPIRTIPTFLFKNDEVQPTPRWSSFMGVPADVLHNKPELNLNTIIQPEQECLPGIKMQIFEEDDESFAEPDMSNHFELKLDDMPPEEENVGKIVGESPIPTIRVTDVSRDKFDTILESLFEDWQRKRGEQESHLRKLECERIQDAQEVSAAKEIAQLKNDLEQETRRREMSEAELVKEQSKSKMLEIQIAEMNLSRNQMQNEIAEQVKILEASLHKLKESKDYYKQKWLQLIREVNKLNPSDND